MTVAARKHRQIVRSVAILAVLASCAGFASWLRRPTGGTMGMNAEAVIEKSWWSLPAAWLAESEVGGEVVVAAELAGGAAGGAAAAPILSVTAPVLAVGALGICVAGATMAYQASPLARRLLADAFSDPLLCFKDADTGLPCCNTAVQDLKCDQNGICKMHEKDIPSCKHAKTQDSSSWFCVSWRSNEGTAGRIFSEEYAARDFFMQKSLGDGPNSILCNASGVSQASRSSRHLMDKSVWAQMEQWCKDRRNTSADVVCPMKADTANCGCGWIDDRPSCEKGQQPGSGCYDECRDANPSCFCPALGGPNQGASPQKPTSFCPTKHDTDGCECGWIDDEPSCHHDEGACFEPCRRANPDCFCPGR